MPRGRPKKAPGAAKGERPNGPLSKTEAVRQALADLGAGAGRLALRDHVRAKFGIAMTPNHVSHCKSVLLKKAAGGRAAGSKHGGAAAAKVAGAEGGVSLDDIRAVKALVDRLGADNVRGLAEVLAR